MLTTENIKSQNFFKLEIIFYNEKGYFKIRKEKKGQEQTINY